VVVLTPRMKWSELLVTDTGDYADAVPSGLRNTAGPSYLSFAAGVNRRVNGASMHGVYSPEEPLGAELGDAIDRGAVSSVLFVTRDADRSAWQLDRLQEVLRRVGKGNEGSRRKVTVVVLASCGPYDLLPRAAPSILGQGIGIG